MTQVQMPALTGTDKQVVWANDIREKAQLQAVVFMANWGRKVSNGFAPAETVAVADGIVAQYLANLAKVTSAAKWIENRNSFDGYADKLMAGCKVKCGVTK